MVTIADIRQSILQGRSKETANRIEEALTEGMEPKTILEDALIPAMRDVGSLEEIVSDIPRILSAARCVRMGLDAIEPHLQDDGRIHFVGTVIIGTVEGDLHDVGKNLVAIMFRSVGLNVIDLGVNVSSRQFLKAIKEHPEAQIISLSSLLTTSLPEVAKVVAAIRRTDKKRRLKIMVGGGAVTAAFAESIGADLYTQTAVDAAQMARSIICQNDEKKEQELQ